MAHKAAAEPARDPVSGEPIRAWFTLQDAQGFRALKEQVRGMDYISERMQGESVLDLGCAEGLISRWCVGRGARLVDGLEIEAHRVDWARRECAAYKQIRFWQADLNRRKAVTQILGGYDIVLLLAILHKLHDPVGALRWASARAGKYVVIRMPGAGPKFTSRYDGKLQLKPMKVLTEFELVDERIGPRKELVMTFRRRG